MFYNCLIPVGNMEDKSDKNILTTESGNEKEKNQKSEDSKENNNNQESHLDDNSVKIIRQNNPSQLNFNYDYLFKIALIGDSGIGKSSILIRFTDNDFREDTTSTIGVDFKIVSVCLGGDKYAKMQIWDTCGSERFKSLTSSFIKSCPAFLLIFDITKQKSFKNLESWMSLIKESTNPRLLCLIGNKSDLEEFRQVTREEAMGFAEKHGLNYIETSAKTNDNIENVFIHVSQSLYNEVIKRKNSDVKSLLGSSAGFEIGGFKNIHHDQLATGNENEGKVGGCC